VGLRGLTWLNQNSVYSSEVCQQVIQDSIMLSMLET